MKNLKNILAILIASMLCLSLAACGGDDEEKENKADETKIEAQSDEGSKDPENSDETNSSPEETKETEKEEDEPDIELDYDFSAYAGTWQYNNEFLVVDEEGNWDYTTGGEENFVGSLKYEKGKVVTYVEGMSSALDVFITAEGNLTISGFATFQPSGASSQGGETDMSVFEGEWYLGGDINAKFYYRVNADGSWTQFERDEESSTQVDSGKTIANTEDNMFTLISGYGSTIIAEYDSSENTMYINGDAYVHIQ